MAAGAALRHALPAETEIIATSSVHPLNYAILHSNRRDWDRTLDQRLYAYRDSFVIFDSIEHAGCYFTGDWWKDTLAYIRAATPALPDGVHQIRGDSIVARVHTGQTRPEDECALESHRAYVDVHVVLDGRETIALWPTDRLVVRTPYSDRQDVAFYDPPSEAGLRLTLSPGFFAVLFPQDAHMTQVMDRRPAAIKKLVMKISVGLIGNASSRR